MAAGGVNIAILVRRATSDPTIRTVKGGVSQAVFGITTNEVWFDKETNERREKIIPHRIVVYGPLVRAVEKCVRRGCLVFVQGIIETRRWTGKDGSPGRKLDDRNHHSRLVRPPHGFGLRGRACEGRARAKITTANWLPASVSIRCAQPSPPRWAHSSRRCRRPTSAIPRSSSSSPRTRVRKRCSRGTVF